MYKTLTLSLVTLAAAAANAHNTTDSITYNYPEGFTVTEIGKTARELCPDSVSPSTPLDFYLYQMLGRHNGQEASVGRYFNKAF